MIRPPFLTSPQGWMNSSRRGHDRIGYACTIEVGKRPWWFWLVRLFRG